jgi:uncharacterized damage-inducible protein DinB
MPAFAPPVSDERDGLLAYLAQQRSVLRVAVYGLSEEQARLKPTASALCLGGLIKHIAYVERNWMGMVRGAGRQSSEAYVASFQLDPDETFAWALANYEEAAKETEALIAGIDDLGRDVPVPQGVPWYPSDVDNWSVRWVLLHLIEETARHAGHADILREALDGATAFPLMAAVEGWPETPWMKPWRPASPDA